MMIQKNVERARKNCIIACLSLSLFSISTTAQVDSTEIVHQLGERQDSEKKIKQLRIPRKLPVPRNGKYVLKGIGEPDDVAPAELTLDPDLQEPLARWLKKNGDHIAALVIAEVASGNILAFVQGKTPKSWGSKVHSALFTGFPAASLFKLTSTVAAIEMLGINANTTDGLRGGCGSVHPRGVWLKDQVPSRNFRMSLKRAFALSCNGYYAQLGIKRLGVGPVLSFASKLGWNSTIPSDFLIPASPLVFPLPKESSVSTVGKFTAGFGMVGISAVHSAWQMLVIANDGAPIPIRITKSRKAHMIPSRPLFSRKTAAELRQVMKPTTTNGTATYAFKDRRYRRYKHLVGGKTGTLTGKSPKGLTTWFSGMMPIDQPQIVVAAVAVVGDRWFVKGPNIAAEAFRLWDLVKTKRARVASKKRPR